jgi:hypothetical protein
LCQLVAASPLLIFSLQCPLVVLTLQLVVALPLAVLLFRHPLVNSSRQLVVALPLLVRSLRPMPPSHSLVAPAGCCVASAALLSSRCLVVLLSRCLVASSPHRLVVSSYHRLIVSPSCRAASRCLVAPAGCRAIISCCPQVAPPSRPLIVLAGCCVAFPCAALSSSCCSPSLTPSNAIERCYLHQTPPPPPPLPQLPSTATVKRQRPPSSPIAAVKR